MDWLLQKENEKVIHYDTGKSRGIVDIEGDYDVIYVEDSIAMAGLFRTDANPYGAILKELSKHLKENGKIFITVDNRFGLKYFAGAPHPYNRAIFGGFSVSSVDDYKSLTKGEWERTIGEAGLKVHKFYYPYPDHKAPKEIFTDASIQAYPYGRAYEDDHDYERLHLFDESDVAAALSRDGAAPYFANSFIIEVAPECYKNDEELFYLKLNTNRQPAHRTATALYMRNGSPVVIKYPLTKEAILHVSCLRKNEESQDFPHIRSLRGEYKDNHMEYPFLKAVSLDKEISESIEEGDLESVYEILDRFFDTYFAVNTERIDYRNEGFIKFFGEEKIGESIGALSVKPANIDLIADNIFPDGDDYTLIDCEWVLPQAVPVSFIKWRTLNELYLRYGKLRSMVSRDRFYGHFDIAPDEAEVYIKWNKHFIFEYLKEEGVPEKSKDMRGADLDHTVRNLMDTTFFFDHGKGYSREYCTEIKAFSDHGKFDITVNVPESEEVKAIRFDPFEGAFSYVEAKMETSEGIFPMTAINGLDKDGRKLFLTIDPMLELSGKKFGNYIRVFGEYELLGPEETEKALKELGESGLIAYSKIDDNMKKKLSNRARANKIKGIFRK